MYDECDTDADGAGHRDEYRRRGAILDDLDLRMEFRIQMVGQGLDGGVEELRGENRRARQQDRCPPEGAGAKHHQRDHHERNHQNFEPHAALGAQRMPEARERKAGAPQEIQILVIVSGRRRIVGVCR